MISLRLTALTMVLALGFAEPARAEEPVRARLAAFRPALQISLDLPPDQYDDPAAQVEVASAAEPSKPVGSVLPRECKPRYMVGPGLGIPLGIGAMTLGGVVVWAGTGCWGWAGVDCSAPRSTSERAAMAGGALLLGAGAATLIYSSIKLHRNMQTRTRVCGGTHLL